MEVFSGGTGGIAARGQKLRRIFTKKQLLWTKTAVCFINERCFNKPVLIQTA